MTLVPYWDYTDLSASNGSTAGKPLTNIPSVAEMRNRWCFGLPLTQANGASMADEDIRDIILNNVADVEKRLGVYLKPTTIVCNPEERGLVQGVDFDVREHAMDYDVNSYINYGFLQLRRRPVQSIEGLKMVLPNGLVIVDFTLNPTMRQWIKLDYDNGQVNLVPYAGDPTLFALLGGTNTAYPFVTGSINANVPSMFYVDYTAGYGVNLIPREISAIVAKLSACDILGIAGEALLAGVASMSTSIDGLSESYSTTASATNTTYGAHIYQYQKDIEEFFDPTKGGGRSYYRGITMIGL